jgi:transposase
MLNIDKVDNVYLACGVTDLRKSIDGLAVLVKSSLKLDPYEKALFVFCNRSRNRLKILHYDNGFWLYYNRKDNGRFKWPMNYDESMLIDKNELDWLLKGFEIRRNIQIKEHEIKNCF